MVNCFDRNINFFIANKRNKSWCRHPILIKSFTEIKAVKCNLRKSNISNCFMSLFIFILIRCDILYRENHSRHEQSQNQMNFDVFHLVFCWTLRSFLRAKLFWMIFINWFSAALDYVMYAIHINGFGSFPLQAWMRAEKEN